MLDLPVVLVIDARGMTRGIAPLILGYQAFDRDIRIAGVILNQLGGSRHEAKLRAGDRALHRRPGAGRRPPRSAARDRRAPARPHAVQRSGRRGRRASPRSAPRSARAGRPRPAARASPPTRRRSPSPATALARRRVRRRRDSDLRIGVAQDRAFGFYYADDLDALRAAGATLVALRHARGRAPARRRRAGHRRRISGALRARARGQRARCATRIRAAIDAGLPVYAECGGLMYLARSLTREGHSYRMVGAIPATS